MDVGVGEGNVWIVAGVEVCVGIWVGEGGTGVLVGNTAVDVSEMIAVLVGGDVVRALGAVDSLP